MKKVFYLLLIPIIFAGCAANKSIPTQPNFVAENYFLFGKEAILQNDFDSAIQLYKKAVEADSNSVYLKETLLEALALGLPAICTNVGAISDSLHHGVNGFLLLDGTTESIKLAMKKYLQQPELIEMQSAESLKIFHSQHNREENCKRLFDQFF